MNYVINEKKPPLFWGDDAVAIIDAFFLHAHTLTASDIHVQPAADHVEIRLRVDGVLSTVYAVPHQQARQVVSRLKVLSERDIMQTQIAQDGALRVVIAHRAYDVRVSFFPSLYGEKVVLRMLSQDHEHVSLSALGVSAAIEKNLFAITQAQQGFFLVTGPTGAGKTTTLYAMLRAVDRYARNVVTFEDPIEYRIAGVTQTQAGAQLPFSTAVRALLRQDPDVALIGEIRDQETGCSAIEAALTGHLVLSSLHTTRASAAPLRLQEMGVPPHLIAHALTGVLAQRLVPALCANCRQLTEVTPDQQRWLATIGISLTASWQTAGCTSCRFTGVQGRCLLAELFVPDQQARHALLKEAPDQQEIEGHARRCALVPMHAAGISLVKEGRISLASLINVGL